MNFLNTSLWVQLHRMAIKVEQHGDLHLGVRLCVCVCVAPEKLWQVRWNGPCRQASENIMSTRLPLDDEPAANSYTDIELL